MKRIVCFHLFNDYSGSPKVLSMVLSELLDRGYSIDLITSRGGILDNLANHDKLKIYHYDYQYSSSSATTMVRYLGVQVYTFFFAFRYLFKQDIIFYINTLLPIAPALSGRMMGKSVIYHYHENASVKGLFYKSLSWGMQKIASSIICVSSYQRSFLKREKNVTVIPNTLSPQFCAEFDSIEYKKLEAKKIVLMLSSLKLYKGTLEFIQLAHTLPDYIFHLVINDSVQNIQSFISENKIDVPSNLKIFDRQDNVIPFYKEASLILNLSNKDLFIETFGLTALEAMTAAVPVIVPTEGGIAEMVEDGVNGYKIDVHDLKKIQYHIEKIFSDNELYTALSSNAKKASREYSTDEMCKKLIDLF